MGIFGLDFLRVWNVPWPGFQMALEAGFCLRFVQPPFAGRAERAGTTLPFLAVSQGFPYLVTFLPNLLREPWGSIHHLPR